MAQLLPARPYVGTRDFYPEDMRLRNWYFNKIRKFAASFCYEEVQGPLLESFDLFAAKSGEELVKEQVYHFYDKGNRHLAIRPEMTPTVARMVAGRLNDLRVPIRWFSIANFMRYERPQKGRLREFYQLNVDILGVEGTRADIEVIDFIISLLNDFGADSSMFRVKISNRRLFNDVINDILKVDTDAMIISKAIDKKAKISPEKYTAWLKESGLSDERIGELDEIMSMGFKELKKILPADSRGAEELSQLFDDAEKLGLSQYLEFDLAVVRGLEYYTGTVFEVYDLSPENKRALFGGGRYDNLIGLFKKEAMTGIGFGMGDVIFQDFLQTHGLIPEGVGAEEKLLVAVFPEVPYAEYLKLSKEWRAVGLRCAVYAGASSRIKKQIQFAEKENYRYLIIMGGDEFANGTVTVKDLQNSEQWLWERKTAVQNLIKK